jgi:hypothetical protein
MEKTMLHQKVLDVLTEGYSRFAQMSLSTANLLGYLRDPFYRFITTNEDGIHYIIEPHVLDSGEFEFSAHLEHRPIRVDGDYTVLVYVCASPAPMSKDEQIDALWNFAMQFPPNTLIRQFLCEHAIAWLERNKETPSLYDEYLRMKIAVHKLEDAANDLEEVYG